VIEGVINMPKLVRDISTGDNCLVPETFEKIIKENFSKLYDGETFIVNFEGMYKEVFMTNDLKIQLRNCKEV
jgi:hypothetical protein